MVSNKSIKTLKDKTRAELQTLLQTTRADWFKMKLDLKVNKLKNLHAAKSKRKEIARLLTLIKEKDLRREK